MKIGLVVSDISNIKNTLDFCAEAALDGIQPYVCPDTRVRDLASAVSDRGMQISAFCGELGGMGLMLKAQNSKSTDKLKALTDLAAECGVSIITTHIGVIPRNPDCIWDAMHDAMTLIGRYAASAGVTIAIETGPEPADVLGSFIDSLDGGVGVNLDPANFVMVCRQNPAAAVMLLDKYIVHTHIKDGKNLLAADPRFVYGFALPQQAQGLIPPDGPVYEETPVGCGDVDWDAYIKALRAIGYDGYLTIERECGSDRKGDILRAVEFLRNRYL